MEKKGGLLLALVLLVTGAMRMMMPGAAVPQTPSSGEGVRTGTARKEKSERPAESRPVPSLGAHAADLSDTIEAFFGDDHGDPLTEGGKVPDPKTRATELIKHWNVPDRDRKHIQFLIALAPDPVHTELSLFFDRGIETIQQASQEAGYDFDRAFMPWDSSPHAESNDFQKRADEEADAEARESLPGLMIFRPALENIQLGESQNVARVPLFVFVIGETATAGIHKNQFANALQIMCEIRDDCPPQNHSQVAAPGGVGPPKEKQSPPPKVNAGPPPPLLILGPSSSGSLYALAQSLRLNRGIVGDRRVFVFSGSTRGTSQTCWFLKQEETLLPRVRFVPFQEGEDALIRRFIDFAVKERGYQPRDTAILSEDETSYGYSDGSTKEKDNSFHDPRCELGYGNYDKADSDKGNNHGDDPDGTSLRILKLQFPRGISHFRAAYQKFVGVVVPPQDSSGGRAVLPLDLQATGSDDDTVASYAKIQSPLSQEAVMLGIVAQLRDRHPKFVVLRASDAVDQLFLTRYLRQNYPEARVVVTAPDLLYAREDDGLLHGVLGISAYSLAPQVNRYLCHRPKLDDSSPRSQRVFPGSSDQGVYNAMVGLLAIGQSPIQGDELFAKDNPPLPLKGKQGNFKDLPAARYSGYGSFNDWRKPKPKPGSSDTCELAPEIWITMLAQDGYWMAAYLLRDNSSSLHAVSEDGHPAHEGSGPATPKPWIFLFSFIVLLLSAHVYFVCFGTIFSASEIRARFGSIEDPVAQIPSHRQDDECANDSDDARKAVRLQESRDSRRRRARLLAWGTASLASIALLLVGARYAAVSADEGNLSTFLLILPSLILTAVVSLTLHYQRGESGIAFRLFAGIAIMAGITFSSFGPRHWLTSLTAYRCMHLLTGVSPLLPFLFLIGAVYCMGWYELQSVAVTDVRRPRLPCRADLPVGFYRVAEEDQKDLRRLATSLSFRGRVFLPVLAFIVPFILLTVDFKNPHPVQTIEGRNYDWFFFGMLLLWVILFLGCLSRLVCVWNECRRFLGGLDSLSLRDAFRNLQDFSWSLIWAPSGSALRDSFKYVSRELQGLRRLQAAIDERLAIDASEGRPEKRNLVDVKNEVDRAFRIEEQAISEYRNIRLPYTSWATIKQTAALMDKFGELQQQLAKTGGVLLGCLLQPLWRDSALPVASDLPDELKKNAPAKSPIEVLAEEFVSLIYANFLTSVLLRIRSLVLEAIGIFLLLLFSISSYPFEPNPDMFTLAVLLIVVLGVVVGYVYSQMHRDPALSRLTSTKEGQVGFEFWVQLLSAGALPVLSLLAVQFPSISRVLTNWLGPALQAIK
jgi:hypothetical protein